MVEPENIPENGVVFSFGKSRFSDNSSCFWLKSDEITCMSCGDDHTAFVTRAGKVYTFGSNDWGQLGLGHSNSVNKPVCVKLLKMHHAKMVACGRNHTLVSTEDNKLFTFGNNGDAQLGVEYAENSNVPLQVDSSKLGIIRHLDAGADFSAVLNEDYNVFVWGSNAEGQLGLGSDVNEVIIPTLLKMDQKIIWISCGYYHMAAVSDRGCLYTFGEDENGKLGERGNVDTCIPSKVVLDKSVHVSKVSCGGSHTAFISNDGALYTFGDGTHGQLGHGADVLHTEKPILVERLHHHKTVHVSCGENFTCAISEIGRLYTFGDGRYGKLALGEENFTNQFKPYRCMKFNNYVVSIARCGGCHLMVLAYKQNSEKEEDSDEEDPMQSTCDNSYLGGNLLDYQKNTEDLSEDLKNTITSLKRNQSAREKRRNGRVKLSQTLPSLRTLRHGELLEVAKSLPKLSATQLEDKGFVNDWSRISEPDLPKKTLEYDVKSEISVFNKVHVVGKDGDLSTLTPVQQISVTDNSAKEGQTSLKVLEQNKSHVGLETGENLHGNKINGITEESCKDDELTEGSENEYESEEEQSEEVQANGQENELKKGETINTVQEAVDKEQEVIPEIVSSEAGVLTPPNESLNSEENGNKELALDNPEVTDTTASAQAAQSDHEQSQLQNSSKRKKTKSKLCTIL